MPFVYAVRTCFRKYVDFSGRARPSEYWWWVLFYLGVVGVGALSGAAGVGDLIDGNVVRIGFLGLFLPTLAVSVRRLHDTGRSGWYYLLGLIPLIGSIIVIVFMIQAGNPGTNLYGEPVALKPRDR